MVAQTRSCWESCDESCTTQFFNEKSDFYQCTQDRFSTIMYYTCSCSDCGPMGTAEFKRFLVSALSCTYKLNCHTEEPAIILYTTGTAISWPNPNPTKVEIKLARKCNDTQIGTDIIAVLLNDETEGSTGFRAPRNLYRHLHAKCKGVYRFPRGSKSRRPQGFHCLRYLYYTAGNQSNCCLY